MMAETDRKKFLGGSDAAAILGLSRWRTPLDVYLDKIEAPRPVDPARAKLFKRGKRLEPVVIDMLAEEHGVVITKRSTPEAPNRYQDPEYPFLAAEIDAEAGSENIEIKTVHPFKAGEWGEEDTDEMPIEYAIQAQHGLMVTGRAVCLFGVLIGADNLLTYRVERDDELIADMRSRELAFWQDHVIALVPPNPLRLDDVNRLYRKNGGEPIYATTEIAETARQLREVRDRIKAFVTQEEELEFAVKSYMKDASELLAGGKVIVTWKPHQQHRLDGERLRTENPEVFAAYQKTIDVRPLRLAK